MMRYSDLKDLLYNWNGANEFLFHAINDLSGDPLYDSVMVAISNASDHRLFPYYMGGLFALAVLTLLFRLATGKAGAKGFIFAWFGIFCVLAAGYAVDGKIIGFMKEQYAYPRPYVVFPASDMHLLMPLKAEDANRSFPSGHASFATLMVVGLWPVLSPQLAFAGTLFILAVCWSRIAVGAHFPADVLAGFLLTMVIVLILRAIIYIVLRRLFKIRC